jgi:16S rRNA processing protein RimM
MQKEDCFELGHITKTTGYKGLVTAFFDVDIPEYYSSLDLILIDLKEGLIPFMIEEMEYRGKKKFRLKLEGVDSIEDAESLVKKGLYLPLEILPPLEDDQFYYHEVIGWMLVDEKHGDLGEIVAVNDNSSNPLLVVKMNDKEVLLPLIDEFMVKVDRDQQKIIYAAPEGLIELYASGDQPNNEDE